MTTQDNQVLIALSTCPDDDTAQIIATQLVEKHLAACVNIMPNTRSVYRWQDKIESDDEVILLIKTTKQRFNQIKETLISLHPYELPELIGVSVSDGLPAYLEWVAKETGITT